MSYKTLKARLFQKHRTINYPPQEPVMPPRLCAMPQLISKKCVSCGKCLAVCPTDAVNLSNPLSIDLGKCIFCGRCAQVCAAGAITFTNNYKLAADRREATIIVEGKYRLASELRSIFGRSLKLRQVSAGGCNACEADVNVLNTTVFDIGRFGVQFVASPRHADGLLITGPVTKNMESALRETYDAVPDPKIVIAAGACAISGGLYARHSQTAGIPRDISVDLFIPGCPPHPMTILDGLLRLLSKIK